MKDPEDMTDDELDAELAAAVEELNFCTDAGLWDAVGDAGSWAARLTDEQDRRRARRVLAN